jgi:CheY-like chemotaxis protein
MDQLNVMKTVKILVVEDSPSDVRLIREALRGSPMVIQITVARDGVEAMEYLHHCKKADSPLPELILLDLNLPRKNGREVLMEVKSDPQLKSVPVLIMSSSYDEDDIAQAYSLNANCYIRKPIDLVEYQRVVRAIEDFWFMTVTLPETFDGPLLAQSLAVVSHRVH